jgi:DNA-binding transcriptional ArsR family regulator
MTTNLAGSVEAAVLDYATEVRLQPAPSAWPPQPDPLDDELFAVENRRRVFELVRQTPGLHLRGLQRAMGLPLGTVEYHLRQLMKHRFVVTRQYRIKGYFPVEGMARQDRDVMLFLRQEMTRRIALFVVDRPNIAFHELCELMPVTSSTVSFHVRKLVDSGVLTETRCGREKRFEAKEPQRIRGLIVRYRTSFVDRLVDRFADAWMDIGTWS